MTAFAVGAALFIHFDISWWWWVLLIAAYAADVGIANERINDFKQRIGLLEQRLERQHLALNDPFGEIKDELRTILMWVRSPPR